MKAKVRFYSLHTRIILLLCLFVPSLAATASADYRFNSWSVRALKPAQNPPLCVMEGKEGSHSVMIGMYLDPTRTLSMDFRKERSIFNTVTGGDWKIFDGESTLVLELDGQNWSVPIGYDGRSDRMSLEIKSPNRTSVDVSGGNDAMMSSINQSIQENSNYVRRLIGLIMSNKMLTIKDPSGKKALVSFNLAGFSDAYQAFNRCILNGGQL